MTPGPSGQLGPPTCRYSVKKDPSSVFSSCLWAGGDRGVRESRRPRPRGADRGVTRAAGGRTLSPAGRVGMPGQSGVGGTLGGGGGPPWGSTVALQAPAISHKRKLKRPQSQSEGHGRLSRSRRHGGCWASNPQLPPFFPAPQPPSRQHSSLPFHPPSFGGSPRLSGSPALRLSTDPAAAAPYGSRLQVRLRKVQ